MARRGTQILDDVHLGLTPLGTLLPHVRKERGFPGVAPYVNRNRLDFVGVTGGFDGLGGQVFRGTGAFHVLFGVLGHLAQVLGSEFNRGHRCRPVRQEYEPKNHHSKNELFRMPDAEFLDRIQVEARFHWSTSCFFL